MTLTRTSERLYLLITPELDGRTSWTWTLTPIYTNDTCNILDPNILHLRTGFFVVLEVHDYFGYLCRKIGH